jgi:hypothetical protein
MIYYLPYRFSKNYHGITALSSKNRGKKGAKVAAKLNACGVTAQLLKKLTQIRHKSNNPLSGIDWT